MLHVKMLDLVKPSNCIATCAFSSSSLRLPLCKLCRRSTIVELLLVKALPNCILFCNHEPLYKDEVINTLLDMYAVIILPVSYVFIEML